MLHVDDLVVEYGHATALDGVSLRIEPGEMVALVGPNGAGKSTLVNTLSGVLRPSAGSFRLDGRIAQVPEGRQLFSDLSVADNLRLGAWGSRRDGRDPKRIYEVLPELAGISAQLAGTLSGGQQQMVAVGRALMADPDLLAVDELSLGLAPIVVATLARHLRQLNAERGTAVLLIEQNARLAFDLCERGYVLENGRITAEGPCAELAQSPQVARAYLGGLVQPPAAPPSNSPATPPSNSPATPPSNSPATPPSNSPATPPRAETLDEPLPGEE